MLRRICHALCLALAIASAAAPAFCDNIVLVPNLAALGYNDFTKWAQLGGDQTVIPVNFKATSAGGVTVSGTFQGGNNGGLVAVVCPSANPCSWTGANVGFVGGDTLVWTNDGTNANGPLSLAFSKKVSAVGFWFQASPPGGYSAFIQAFNGANAISQDLEVDSNANGDPVFVGIVDKDGTNITSVVIAGCSNPCNDFGIDTVYTAGGPPGVPEPTAVALFVSGLATILWRSRPRA